MKKIMCGLLTFMLVVCLAVPAGAQEPVYTPHDCDEQTNVTVVDINGEEQETPVCGERVTTP